ncbi:TolC family protein [Undibacterium oligocarboniphilum]|uniref:TolC family protein n=1 Tax=Undibacterium oligocarboniphilum TaxID=666702 RepID=A0A850QEG6_9BURK|nr:TolC family protein [Undibacterium oligocarboniphilum]MBC3869684.1 TolC family protein [Undibacterium oligocarboniphilum]NVO77287.1 TolC family protein [Undibacterium oligocarboniphilum]
MFSLTRRSALWFLPAAWLLTACSSFQPEQAIGQINQDLAAMTQSRLRLAQYPGQMAQLRASADELLQQELTQPAAVSVALANSPAMQAMLAQYWADGAAAVQSGNPVNLWFRFERSRLPDELDIARAISVGLLDLLTLPQRKSIAQSRLQQTRLQLSMDVVDRLAQVRAAWVKAVAAQQALLYAQQVSELAEAGAELAQRMRKTGNFSTLQAARQQAFHADAATQLAAARHRQFAAREVLVRLLGLDEKQQQQLRLPSHLPELPAAPVAAGQLAATASQTRLDVRLAQAQFENAMRQQGLNSITSLTDLELTVKRDTVFAASSAGSEARRGVEVAVRLPVFDTGQLQREAMNAQTLAASYRLEQITRNAASSLREAYSAYLRSYDIAQHYHREILPLRQRIADENQLRYNGMLIGVFELLGEAREQIASVIAAINTEQQFWLDDATLQAELTGTPANLTVSAAVTAVATNNTH